GGAAGGTVADGGTYGVPSNGYPTWRERTILVLTNAVRMSPADYKASAAYSSFSPSVNLSTVLGTTYPPVPPLYWDYDLNRSSRQHSQEMAYYDYFAHTSLDGGAPDVRIHSYYMHGGSWGENIAAGTHGSELQAMFQWLCDQPNGQTACCNDGAGCDGHR